MRVFPKQQKYVQEVGAGQTLGIALQLMSGGQTE